MTARLALTVLVVMTGVVTRYDADEHLGNDRRCGGTYNEHEDWVAADIDDGPFYCGQLLTICAAGKCKTLPVKDSGPLSRFCVIGADGVCRDILVDVPEHVAIGWFHGLSTPVRIVDASAVRARWEMEK